jgi:signal transduction histidine kinase
LSQLYGFIRQSRGHVTLDSAPGQGTTVTMYLRRAEVTAQARQDAAA